MNNPMEPACHLHEECGVFGIYSNTEADVAPLVYYGLYALQHRGQESAGIVVNNNGSFSYHTDVDSADALIANHHTVDEIAKIICVDSLGYLSLEHARLLTGEDTGFCTACFGGGYPTAVPQDGHKTRFEHVYPFTNTPQTTDKIP